MKKREMLEMLLQQHGLGRERYSGGKPYIVVLNTDDFSKKKKEEKKDDKKKDQLTTCQILGLVTFFAPIYVLGLLYAFKSVLAL